MYAHFKSIARRMAGTAASRLGLASRVERGRVLVLAYHRVIATDRLRAMAVEPGMYVSNATFRQHLRILRTDYDVLSITEWLGSWTGGRLRLPSSGRFCVITFDDGWKDNYEVAFPLLKEFRLPAAIFLPTGFIGTTRWFWTEIVTWLLMRGDASRLLRPCLPQQESAWPVLLRFAAEHDRTHGSARAEAVSGVIHELKAFPPATLAALCQELPDRLRLAVPKIPICMDWDEVREMAAAGIEFGSHSHNHHLLTQLSPAGVLGELETSRGRLAAECPAAVPVFSYPNGAVDPGVQRLVREAGYEAALTMDCGVEGRAPQDPFAIQRIAVHDDVSRTPSLFAWRLFSASYRGTIAGAPRSAQPGAARRVAPQALPRS